MAEEKGYRIGIFFFALATLFSAAMLPFTVSCCSRFSAPELATRRSMAGDGWASGITPVAVALLDWPIKFRLLLMTLTVSALCLLATVVSARLAHRLREPTAWILSARVVIACLTVGVLYILAVYINGFFGCQGPPNIIWMLGIPVLVALMNLPRWQGFLFGVPLAVGGWIAMGLICLTIGIPLD